MQKSLIASWCKIKNIWQSKQNLTVNAEFHCDKTLNEGSHRACLSVIVINLVFNVVKNFYSQTFPEEFKYVEK